MTCPPSSLQVLREWVGVVMLQLTVELPPGAFAPGGPIAPECGGLLAPSLSQQLGLGIRGEHLVFEELIPEPAIARLDKPFSHGDPGSM